MKKTFISNFILLMSVNLLIKPFWILGIDRGVQNAVGYEQYGIYSNLFAFSMLLITLLDLGINNYTSSNIAKNPENLSKEFAALTTFKLGSGLIYIILTIGLGNLLGYPMERLQLLLLLGFNQILSYFYSFFRSVVGGLQKYKTDALLSVVDRSLMIVLCGAILWFGFFEISIPAFIISQTIAYTIAVLISFSVIKPHLLNLSWKLDFTHFKSVIQKMLPYALLSLLMTFYTRLDVILIPKLIEDGDLQNGIYASAYRLLEAANMMAALVAMLLLPMFSKMISGKENLNPLVQFSTGLMLIPAFSFCLIAFCFQDPIIHLLNNQSNAYAGWVFGLVILCFFPLCIMYIYGTLLTANGSFKTLNILAAMALVLNIGLNLWLIPIYKAYGAAISALVTQGFIGLSNLLFGIKILKVRFEPNFLSRVLISILFISGLMFMLIKLEMNWWQSSIAIGIGTMASMFGLKILDLRQGLELLKSRQSEKASL
jgi:O-antigen/teichoic acid export membrane protein